MTWTLNVRFLCASLLTGLLLVVPSVQAQGTPAQTVDFDAALSGLRFNPKTLDANLDGGNAPNGMLDADEMALVSAVLSNPSLNLGATSGVRADAVRAAFDQARASAQTDLKGLLATYPSAIDVAAGYAVLGKGSFDSYDKMSAGFGAPLKGNYALALQLGRWLAFNGDADGDGVRNIDEYKATIAQGRDAYIKAALDPAVKPTAAQVVAAPAGPRDPLLLPANAATSPPSIRLSAHATPRWDVRCARGGERRMGTHVANKALLARRSVCARQARPGSRANGSIHPVSPSRRKPSNEQAHLDKRHG